MSGTTIGNRLARLNGTGPAFDHLRIGLALSILVWHSFSISYGQDYGARLPPLPVPPFLASLLPMFFGLSGFLVIGSAQRTGDVRKFIGLRVLRIVPALFTEVTISALVLGPLLTTFTLRAYFSSPLFWSYLGSLVGRVRFSLPGLFETNPAPELVNFALWTVGPEILCYVVMALMIVTGIYRSRRGLGWVAVGYAVVALAFGLAVGDFKIGEVMPAKLLPLCFLLGNLVYVWRDRLPFGAAWTVSAYAAGFALVSLSQYLNAEPLVYLAVLFLVYAVATAGLFSLPPMPFFRGGDYSYGIYIFGFPVQQAIAYFLPAYRQWYVNLAIALPVVLGLAYLSWHFIEKPALSLRRYVLAGRGGDAARASPARRAALVAILVAYGVFVIDASAILPTRPGAKMVLWGFGLYHYHAGERPLFGF